MSEVEKRRRPLPPNFLLYDHDNPSPLFQADSVAYIESIAPYFSEDELRRVLQFERFSLNLNTGIVGTSGLPGLREDSNKSHVYVGRLPDQSWQKFVSLFLDCIPEEFPDRDRCINELLRITLPNGDRYYPFTFFGDLDTWRDLMKRAATECGTRLANFEKGKFTISDGQSFDFSQLEFDEIPPKQGIPAKW